MPDLFPRFSEAEILAARPARASVDSQRAYAFLREQERTPDGRIVDVATVFLTNRECPFRCLMCDLWKHTLTQSVETGAIPRQIRNALTELQQDGVARPFEAVKLYNSGNFFDRKAIPREDYSAIARLVSRFETVVVENHPKLCGPDVIAFQQLIAPARLEVALGLETCHPELLAALNKNMTLADFDSAARFLNDAGVRMRAFILLRPPFLTEDEGIDWCLKSLEYAFDRGVLCCSVIPTRGGNGIMEQLAEAGQFHPPTARSLEIVLQRGLAMSRGRVFIDLWDTEKFFTCDGCRAARLHRLDRANKSQVWSPLPTCRECGE